MSTKKQNIRLAAILLGLFIGQSAVIADEYYAGGVVVNIDRVVNGYLWIDDATVNLYKNAHIKTVISGWQGSLYSCSGSILNIYGGKIDDALYITTSYNSLPEAKVTVYGYGFAVNGVAVPAGTPEIYIPYKTLSGFYEDGTPFAFKVDCYAEGNFYMTVKLGWINAEPEMTVDPVSRDFGEVRTDEADTQTVTVGNKGTANLILQSVNLLEGSSEAFSVAPLAQLPITLSPGASIDIQITFKPTEAVSAIGVLRIAGDDNKTPFVDVSLAGKGIAPVIAVEPVLLDFGQINLGSSDIRKITICNKGNADLTVESVVFSAGSTDFTISAAPQLPVMIEPNGLVELEINYTPTAAGTINSVLEITSDDPVTSISQIIVTGKAVNPVKTPLEQINTILTLYDNAVKAKTLYGIGPGNSAKAHLNVTRQTLICAQKLIQAGYQKLALVALYEADKMTDSLGKPKDFVEGPAKAELNLKIKTLIKAIKQN